jgi:uncharacterized protein YbaR (Trm112 family)
MGPPIERYKAIYYMGCWLISSGWSDTLLPYRRALYPLLWGYMGRQRIRKRGLAIFCTTNYPMTLELQQTKRWDLYLSLSMYNIKETDALCCRRIGKSFYIRDMISPLFVDERRRRATLMRARRPPVRRRRRAGFDGARPGTCRYTQQTPPFCMYNINTHTAKRGEGQKEELRSR